MSLTMDQLVQEATPGKFLLQRFPQTDDELWWFVYATFNVKIPRRATCPGHVAPFRAFADAYFARSPVCVWHGSRGFGGKTFLLSLLGLTEMVTLKAFITILGGSGAQSQRVYESLTEFWDAPNAPNYLLSKDPTKYDTFLTNGAKARTLMASQKSVRGPHPQRMRLDEVDEMDYELFKAAQGQPMRDARRIPGVDTNTVASSTWQYPNGTMAQIMQDAKEKGWPVYQWCYRETSNPVDGWLAPEEVERKKSEVTSYMWEHEYELQEPSFEGRAIDTASVEACFDPALGDVPGVDNKYYEFVPPSPSRDYITAVDWAKEKDWTIIGTYDVTETPWRLVAWQREGRMPWPTMIRKANSRLRRYGGKFIHDSTGLGTVVKDYLELPPGMSKRNFKDQTMAGRARSEMLEEYIFAIENRQIIAPRIGYMFDEHRYVTRDDMFGSGHLPDTIAMGALAWYMRPRRNIRGVTTSGVTRPVSPWKVA